MTSSRSWGLPSFSPVTRVTFARGLSKPSSCGWPPSTVRVFSRPRTAVISRSTIVRSARALARSAGAAIRHSGSASTSALSAAPSVAASVAAASSPFPGSASGAGDSAAVFVAVPAL